MSRKEILDDIEIYHTENCQPVTPNDNAQESRVTVTPR